VLGFFRVDGANTGMRIEAPRNSAEERAYGQLNIFRIKSLPGDFLARIHAI